MTAIFSRQQAGIKNIWIFAGLWLLTFLLYVPTIKAGWVIDGVGFLYNLRHQGFWEFINRTHSQDPSFYQLFTLQYYIGYKLWGLNFWMWGLLYITAQAINAYLLYAVGRNVFTDSGLKHLWWVPLCGVLLFAICPHISEVVVCKAYYHYLQSFMFILLIMLWVQKYQHRQKAAYIWGSLLLFMLAAVTLEIFYLVPFFVLTLALYYRFALGYNPAIFRKTVLYFFVPQILLLCVYFAAIFATFGMLHPHKISINQSAIDYLSKPLKYIFDIVFLGRYFPVESKKTVYDMCQSETVLFIGYGMAAVFIVYWVAIYKKMTNVDKALLLFLVWAAGAIAFVTPLPFPDAALLVFYDRYTYFADGFIYILLALALLHFTNKYIAIIFLVLYAGANLYFTIELNTYWKHSAYVNSRLLNDLPDAGGKTIILLDIPENLNGIPMIGAQPDGEYKAMREVYRNAADKNTIYDAASYNMATGRDGAHVTVVNDSMIHVTLNQWGAWWWYEGHGARSYETKDYKLNMVDAGHWYELTLKHPATRYLLLYEMGDQWKIVDMGKRNVEQW
jgi:hypothetical protein